jgi:hypothetical protein
MPVPERAATDYSDRPDMAADLAGLTRLTRANSVVLSCVVNQSGDLDLRKISMPDGLHLPAQVTLQRASLAGPFARGTLSVAPARVPLQNATTAPVTVASTSLTPIVGDASGLAPAFGSGALTATAGKQALDPGEATMVEIAGRVPSRPGSYLTQLDVAADTGASASAPVRIGASAVCCSA